VVLKENLAAAGMELARELAATAPLGYATVKQSIQRALESSMEAEWQANLPNQALLLGSKDHREGLAAVTGKRAPVFRGE
jgi:enoyl-CoA hydratase/carnithine racemase